MVADRSPGIRWHGHELSFWSRWQAWLTGSHRPALKVLHAMRQPPEETAGWFVLLDSWLRVPSWPPPDALVAFVEEQYKVVRHSTVREDAESYEAWLQEAGPHLGPIFKSIKSHEQTQQRPFRDAELLLNSR